GLAAPWFVAVAVLEPGFVGSFFWTQNVVRFVAPFDHAKPFWFHLPGLLLGLLPWTLLLPGLVRWLLLRPGTEAARERPAALGLFLLASLWGLVFFSLAGSKRAAYVLPLLPPLALAGGRYLARCLARSERLTRAAWGVCAAAMFLVLLGGVEFVLPSYARQFSLRGQVRPQAAWCADCRGPVVCYPRRWDSVGFYLGCGDVAVYTADQTGELVNALRGQARTDGVVKSGPDLAAFLAALPASLEFEPRGRPGRGTVGRVRHRTPGGEPLWAAIPP